MLSSFLEECSEEKLQGFFSNFPFLAGIPIVVNKCPFGRPRFLTGTGSLSPTITLLYYM